MKALVRFSLVLVLAAGLTTGLFANGLNLNGFGARATAMGGAFVGLADDYTAVFWNPAGLALIKMPTFGLAGDVLLPSATYGLTTTYASYSMETNSKKYPAGLLGYFQPIGENVVVGIGAYTLSGLGASWDNTGLEAALVAPYPTAAFFPELEPTKWESFIGSITVAPSIAVKLSEMLYVGATFNINYGFFKTDQWGEFVYTGPTAPGNLGAAPAFINLGQQSLNVKGWGFGATFGVLVKPSEWISFGGTFRTQSKINLKGTTEIENLGLLGFGESESDTEMSVVSPMWLAGGVAIKPVEGLTLTFDAQYTNWAKLDEIAVTFGDPQWSALLEEDAALLLNWQNKTQLRFGAEYDFGSFAIRGGYYYDPAPAPDATLNILTPSFTFNSIIGGFGYKSGNFKLDLALEYLMAQDRTVAPSGDNLPGSYQMHILVPQVSLSFGF